MILFRHRLHGFHGKTKIRVIRARKLLNDLLDTDGDFTESESTVELNLAILKVKRTIKKKSKN